MPYTRFELYYEGEPQDIGFMMGLEDTGIDEEEVEKLLEPFNVGLPLIPELRNFEKDSCHFPACYFTEAGIKTFQPYIQRIIDAIAYRDNGWSVNEVKLETALDSDVYYQDEFQAVIKTNYNSLASLSA